ncbi:acyl carrier protein [Paenibacillus phyllosphaerae]|uniref:Acyl carrier protein n=1 Tax=Paenibacillus phyllosphaerae TaxID=274593 RepID=A0A7W5ASS6_9BACL|nr:acyl carrier protein [Paenibacillus phyllosphaerae]MBB3107977.1 acyl carrier protein [Paenibacillus phyllosphaerae]
MEKQQIIQIIKEKIIPNRLRSEGLEPSDIGDDDLISERISLDSIDEFEMIMGIEDEFGIDLGSMDQVELHEQFRTMASLANLVEGQLALQLTKVGEN